MSIKGLLSSSSFMMSLALVSALLVGLTDNFPAMAPSLRSDITIFVLAVMMTVSLSRISHKGLNPLKEPKPMARALVLGTVVASSIPLLAWFLLNDDVYGGGLIFIAATPFAASVVPLSFIMRGDLEHAARSTIVVYLASIVFIPALVWVTLGSTIPLQNVVIAVLEVVMVPMVLSRLLINVKIDREIMAAFLNSCIFLLVFLSVGATAGIFLTELELLSIFIVIALLRTFLLGVGLEVMEKRMGIPWSQRVTDVLMTSYKNKGIAIALCTALLPTAALFPITASIVVEICWVIFMDSFLFSPKRMRRETSAEPAAQVL